MCSRTQTITSSFATPIPTGFVTCPVSSAESLTAPVPQPMAGSLWAPNRPQLVGPERSERASLMSFESAGDVTIHARIKILLACNQLQKLGSKVVRHL